MQHARWAKSLIVICVLFFTSQFCAQAQLMKNTEGYYDLTRINFANERVSLNGHWNFFDHQLLMPAECDPENAMLLFVPGVWNDIPGRKNGVGYGTYSITLLLPSTHHEWALYIPQLYNNYRLYINGKLLAKVGVPDSSASGSIPQWLPQVVTFENQADTVQLVLQISNFHHHKGGIREPIYLGFSSSIKASSAVSIGGSIAEVVLLSAVAVFFLGFFILHKEKRISLYFSILSLCWALRELFSEHYPITKFAPDIDWSMMVRIEYLSLFLLMIFAVLFLNRLFREVSSDLFKYMILIVNILFIGFILFSPTVVFTQWITLYLTVSVVTLLYALFLLIRALLLDLSGVWFLIVGLMLIILLSGYDLIAYKGFLVNNQLFSSIGYMLVFTSLSIGLLQHLNVIKTRESSRTMLTYQDLYRKR